MEFRLQKGKLINEEIFSLNLNLNIKSLNSLSYLGIDFPNPLCFNSYESLTKSRNKLYCLNPISVSNLKKDIQFLQIISKDFLNRAGKPLQSFLKKITEYLKICFTSLYTLKNYKERNFLKSSSTKNTFL